MLLSAAGNNHPGMRTSRMPNQYTEDSEPISDRSLQLRGPAERQAQVQHDVALRLDRKLIPLIGPSYLRVKTSIYDYRTK